MIAGYARIYTDSEEIDLDAQRHALGDAGAERIWIEARTGSRREHPVLNEVLGDLAPGDVLVVTGYDRLSRSLVDLLGIFAAVQRRDAGLRAIAEGIDTTGPGGGAVFHALASVARFERERISERTREGLAAARELGRIGGRPPALDTQQRAEVRRMRDTEGRRIAEIARLFKVSANTVRRA